MASIRDVALKAGVGIGTVSRALNGTGYIAEETKKKILEAAEQLDYKPNELAKNLYRNRSGFIGIVVPDIEHPYFAWLLKCMEQELFQYGYKCMVCDVSGKERRELEFLDMLHKNVMDGLIACVDSLAEVDVESIRRPVVCIERKWSDHIPVIHSDHVKGGELAAELLKNGGCQKVIQFAPVNVLRDPYVNRHIVFSRILEEHGIKVLQANTISNKLGYEYDGQYVRQFEDLIEEADGIFASDLIAAGCLKQAMEKGRRVPEELKIVAYDATPLTRLMHPTITAVVQDVPQLARAGVDMIMKIINGEASIKYDITIDVSLQKGGTV